MRINEHNQTGASSEAGRTQETQRAAGGGTSKSAASGSSGDRVELSSTLGSLSRATAANHSDRGARVQELAAQYETGRYRPDAAATSRAMVSEMLASGIQ